MSSRLSIEHFSVLALFVLHYTRTSGTESDEPVPFHAKTRHPSSDVEASMLIQRNIGGEIDEAL